jgi:predicted ATPase with chaperone activity
LSQSASGAKYSAPTLFEDRIIDIVCDADMPIGEIRKFCKLQDEGQILIRATMMQLNLSAHAYHRILKLAHNCGFGGLQ